MYQGSQVRRGARCFRMVWLGKRTTVALTEVLLNIEMKGIATRGQRLGLLLTGKGSFMCFLFTC